MKKYILTAFAFIFLAHFAQSQVLPPHFLCVKTDTLFWQQTPNTCGAFNSYDVYFSLNPGGPFSLLSSVADPSQTFFFHPNPSGQTRYYYLESNHNCPGQTFLQSDTLDNKPPVVSPIRSVSVENGQVLVTWQPSPSPEVFAYIIYRQTSIGVIPVDTVYSGNTYLDVNSMPELQSETYLVNALDECGTTSIFDLKHKSILMETAVSACEQTITLSWNLYENWPNGIGTQEIWVGVNGAAPAVVASLPASAISYVFENINDGDAYCLYVQAVEAGTGDAAKSNEICLTADVVQPVKSFFIKNVSVTASNEVLVTWNWATNSEITSYDILRSSQNADYQSIETLPPASPLLQENVYSDDMANPGQGKVFYKIQTLDGCGDVAFSTYGSTIFLTGTAQATNSNLLNWTGLDIENTGNISYELFKITNGSEQKIATLPSPASSHEDPIDPNNIADAGACYYILATAVLTTPNGDLLTIKSRSNTACVEQPVRIFVPNAFVPMGFNQVFKPLIALGDMASYEMQVFDRYGQVVFESDTATEGWNGKKDGKEMPQGVYTYRILVTQSNGKATQKSGVVLLLR